MKILVKKKFNHNFKIIILVIFLSVLYILIINKTNIKSKLTLNTNAAPNQIYGGKIVDIKDFPFVVAIFDASRLKLNKNGQSNLYDITTCTGSLISERYVITAKHCVVKWEDNGKTYKPTNIVLNPNTIGIAIGFNNLQTDSVDKDHKFVFGSEVILDPELYLSKDFEQFPKDVALIRINKTIDTKKFNTISYINDTSISNSYSRIMILGYGKTKYFGGNISPNLRNIFLNIKPQKTLNKETLDNTNNFVGLIEVTGYFKGIREGDSGGPLLIWKNNKWSIIGISKMTKSLSSNAAIIESVFSDISYYSKWIFDNSRIKTNMGTFIGVPEKLFRVILRESR